MPETMAVVAIAVISGILGLILGYVTRRVWTATKIRNAESYAERLVTDARTKQKEIILEGKDEILQVQRAAEEEARERRADLQRQERLLLDREHLHHTLVPDRGRRPGLAEEPLAGRGRGRQRRGQHLDRDDALEHLVERPEDDPEPAPAEDL